MPSVSSSSPRTCGTCGKDSGDDPEIARANGWGITATQTFGGKQVTYVICPGCRGVAKKKTRTVQAFDDTPLWE